MFLKHIQVVDILDDVSFAWLGWYQVVTPKGIIAQNEVFACLLLCVYIEEKETISRMSTKVNADSDIYTFLKKWPVPWLNIIL